MTDVIRDLPRDERPRERLLQHGARTLSDAELVAVILGTGAPGKNAIQLARELLMGGVRTLRRRDLSSLASIRGVGPAKVARITAAVELSRRLNTDEPDADDTFDASALGQRLVAGYGHETQERLGAALLDTRHRVLKQREIFVGTNDRTLVSTREIVRFALIEHAKGVVIYHNHPSGDPTPSNEDLSFTKKLEDSLAMCDVDLVDHLVIGAHRYHSMRDRGDL
ncbi:MAG: DNA repair protein RadC [Acidobacteriota bacterium]